VGFGFGLLKHARRTQAGLTDWRGARGKVYFVAGAVT